MEILSVDIGTYSIKFLTTRLERGQTKLQALEEIIIREFAKENNIDYKFIYEIPSDEVESEESDASSTNNNDGEEELESELDSAAQEKEQGTSLHEIQSLIIKDYLDHYPFEAKVVFQLPNELTTTRYLDLPVTNKKKAELMIPFQLEEDLPYTVNDIHFNSTLQIRNKKIFALINITKFDLFQGFYNNLKAKSILPAILTSEVSIVQSFIDQKQMLGSYCILDIGHETTKAYFVHNRHVVSNHISHVAGKAINEAIVKHYNISEDEVYEYKHKNAFFLTDEQYEQMEETQKKFALLLRKVVWPLVQDVRRWDLGYRVKYGHPIDRFYISGGSSNIKNIENFLSQALTIETKKLKAIDALNQDQVSIPKSMAASFFLSHMTSSIHKLKNPPANFLKGKFTSSFSQMIPLHSFSFLASRSLVISFILLVSLLTYRIAILSPEEKNLDRYFSKVIKNPDLGLARKDVNTFRKAPKRILSKFQKKDRSVEQEINTIQSSAQSNSLYALGNLTKIISSNKNIDLIRYYSDSDNIEASFKGDLKELKIFKSFLEGSNLAIINLELDEKDSRLNVQLVDGM